MYKAYVNDKPVVFLPLNGIADAPSGNGIQILSDSDTKIDEAIAALEWNRRWSGIVFLCATPRVTWQEFVKLFILQEAAGGIVRNEVEETLLIFRRGKWDLPKGKIDYDESPEEAAIREVKEECGLKNVELGKELAATFHTYPQDGKRVLKKTHWFRMQSNLDEVLVP